MIGCKFTCTYTPDNIITTPDPAGGSWGDALNNWATWLFETYDGGSFAALSPAGAPTFASCDYVNTTDSSSPAVRIVLVYNLPFAEIDLTVVQTALETASAEATAEAFLNAFDSGASMSFQSAYVEQWSDEETI